MTRCPRCSSDLARDHIGTDREVLLCGTCWQVWPERIAGGVHRDEPLHLVPDLPERRDLA